MYSFYKAVSGVKVDCRVVDRRRDYVLTVVPVYHISCIGPLIVSSTGLTFIDILVSFQVPQRPRRLDGVHKLYHASYNLVESQCIE